MLTPPCMSTAKALVLIAISPFPEPYLVARTQRTGVRAIVPFWDVHRHHDDVIILWEG